MVWEKETIWYQKKCIPPKKYMDINTFVVPTFTYARELEGFATSYIWKNIKSMLSEKGSFTICLCSFVFSLFQFKTQLQKSSKRLKKKNFSHPIKIFTVYSFDCANTVFFVDTIPTHIDSISNMSSSFWSLFTNCMSYNWWLVWIADFWTKLNQVGLSNVFLFEVWQLK